MDTGAWTWREEEEEKRRVGAAFGSFNLLCFLRIYLKFISSEKENILNLAFLFFVYLLLRD
jgi:hypothetical protein